ncbi:MAG: undecaprenyl/decaprenyl-phosphate alpha-N-acetylglucosaminyl 1-phosphate transferase [Bacteroidetes bacterium]|jgi:UDP-N-acetylmuramyl pentapeptide phosphotransferase/UDP-N-acetylglucosamine-1-phosphate transferase|nr:undecaprenyl/decaprenyl-phosphate alpha-N-acetylglucosaminyl 1-phosphate transferase [Bacteroidota bacterium]
MDLLQLSWAVILFIGAFFVSKRGIPVLVTAALSKRLMDEPEEHRKIHDESVPTLGGIVFIGSLWLVFSLHPQSILFDGFGYLLAASLVLFVTAIKDDLFVLSPTKKLLAQFTAAIFLIFGADVYVETFGGVFGIETVPYAASVLVSVAVFVVVTNALNLIDGVDGLAATTVITCSLFFSFWFFTAAIYPLALFSLFFAGAMGGFLWHNREPATVFMGDTGALLSGFYLAFMGIEFLNTAEAAPFEFAWQANTPVILIAILIVPLYDTLRVFLLRVLNGKSPFKADAEHIHHQLLNTGFSHTQVTLSIIGIQIFIVTTAMLLSPLMSVNYLLLTIIALSVLIFPTLSFKRKIISKVTGLELEDENRFNQPAEPEEILDEGNEEDPGSTVFGEEETNFEKSNGAPVNQTG